MAKTITGQRKHVSFTDTTVNTNVTGNYDFDVVNNNLVMVNANYTAKENGKESYFGSASLTKQLDNKLSKNYTLPTDTTIAAELQQHFEALVTELQAEAAAGTTTSSTTVENQEA